MILVMLWAQLFFKGVSHQKCSGFGVDGIKGQIKKF